MLSKVKNNKSQDLDVRHGKFIVIDLILAWELPDFRFIATLFRLVRLLYFLANHIRINVFSDISFKVLYKFKIMVKFLFVQTKQNFEKFTLKLLNALS